MQPFPTQSEPIVPSRAELAAADITIADAHRLGRLLGRARDRSARDRVADEYRLALGRVQRRRESIPTVRYPPELPVCARREDIAAAIAAHQVVVVAGETGSGKTTQIPKICLELGRGVRGQIGHTQPRRIAARTVAERIAEELGTDIGRTVGYKVRFTDTSSDDTLIKLMTDGILLAEIQRDRFLRRYDTLIIDEAHERSLNIDFILGYLAQLLPTRPDLKVIVTSATIDPERFAAHFSGGGEPAPIVEVSGRTFPVEIRYSPLTIDVDEPDGASRTTIDRDPVDATCDAVEELLAEPDGDVLVFLSGEREIRDTADALRERRLPGTEILPLYARLSAAEQHRVFTAHTGRRVVLSTNVAETSLTVPGIRYVVDPGTARISRYSVRTKVQRLPIEPISQASARQRSGRCGRVADGICIRLYSEEDFDSRPAFTEPEILRTNLASVILQMTALGLGKIEEFPFVEPPDARSIRDGVALLDELGALDHSPHRDRDAEGPKLTVLGRELAGLPVDPRMARMLVEANRTGCLPEVLVIVSALSIQDVRERPADHQQAADTKHARFVVEGSDFLAYLRLWDYLREQRNSLSSNQFRRLCKSEFLHYLRIREWQDLHGQLRQIARGLGWAVPDREPSFVPTPADSTTTTTANADVPLVHRALLAGLLSHIGVRNADSGIRSQESTSRPADGRRGAASKDFLGARGSVFAVFPGSSLFTKPPRWIMAAELVETSRLWARIGGRIEPEWVEALAGQLVKRVYSEPHWSIKREAAMAHERVTLYGVPLVTARPVPYGTIDPVHSRELFIRHALVQGEWRTHHAFFGRNQQIREEVAELENRARRRDMVVDDDTLFNFYNSRLPESVVSARHFDRWWKTARRTDPELLDFQQATVINTDAAPVVGGDYPDAWRQGDLRFALTYQFEPGDEDDGVSIRIALPLLPSVRDVGFDWLVPGMRQELAAAMIKTLPKDLRRQVVPAPDFAAAALAVLRPRVEPFTRALARELTRLSGSTIEPGDFDPEALPRHLRLTFVAVDDKGAVLGRSVSLGDLRNKLGSIASSAVAQAVAGTERSATTRWTSESIGTIPTKVTRTIGRQSVTGYPALVPESGGVAVRVLATPEEQSASMRAGTRHLLIEATPVSMKAMLGSRSNAQRLALSQNPHGSLDALVADCHALAVDEVIASAGGPVLTPQDFEALSVTARARVPGRTADLVTLIEPVLAEAARVRSAIENSTGDPSDDVSEQLDSLVFDGFVFETGADALGHVPRYLRGAAERLATLPASADRDRAGMAVLDRVYADYDALLRVLPAERTDAPDVRSVFWLIEELRVSLFAQRLGTAHPVSEKRVRKAIADLR